jgi:hypothetical protein
VQQPPTPLPVGLQLRDLLAHLALGLRAGLEALEADDQLDRGLAGRVHHRDAGVVARLFEQQLAVVGERPAGAPGDVVVGLAVDMRHVEAIADDAHALARDALAGERALALGAEPLRFEVAVQVGRRDLVEQRREAVVHARLVVRLGRRRDPAVLARGDDVARAGREVAHCMSGRHEGRAGGNDDGGHGRASHRSPLL